MGTFVWSDNGIGVLAVNFMLLKNKDCEKTQYALQMDGCLHTGPFAKT